MENNNDKQFKHFPEDLSGEEKELSQKIIDTMPDHLKEKYGYNDKAKKILFGREDIEKNPDYELYTGKREKIPLVATVKPPIDTSMDEKCACGGVYQKTTDPAAFVCSKCNTTKIIHPSMDIQNEKYDDVLDQMQRVFDYCKENNISTDQLIEQHRVAYKDI